jgi:hypothetical protein
MGILLTKVTHGVCDLKELASPRSGLPIQPTSGKIRVRKSMKFQRSRRGVPKVEVESVSQVPEYALDCLLMRIPCRRLKMSTQTYGELDDWPRRRQVRTRSVPVVDG